MIVAQLRGVEFVFVSDETPYVKPSLETYHIASNAVIDTSEWLGFNVHGYLDYLFNYNSKIMEKIKEKIEDESNKV